MITFTNPRLTAEIPDWPLGGSKRGTATFRVEHTPKRGYRISRVTTGMPKYTTYCSLACIVDGDDGRTYLLMYNTVYGRSVRVASSDMQHDADPKVLGHDAYVSEMSNGVRFEELKDLIVKANESP